MLLLFQEILDALLPGQTWNSSNDSNDGARACVDSLQPIA